MRNREDFVFSWWKIWDFPEFEISEDISSPGLELFTPRQIMQQTPSSHLSLSQVFHHHQWWVMVHQLLHQSATEIPSHWTRRSHEVHQRNEGNQAHLVIGQQGHIVHLSNWIPLKSKETKVAKKSKRDERIKRYIWRSKDTFHTDTWCAFLVNHLNGLMRLLDDQQLVVRLLRWVAWEQLIK